VIVNMHGRTTIKIMYCIVLSFGFRDPYTEHYIVLLIFISSPTLRKLCVRFPTLKRQALYRYVLIFRHQHAERYVVLCFRFPTLRH
jgi:hypothetical protein